MFWDFISLRPETTHQVMFLFGDRGIPDGYRHMNGYGSHTFKLINNKNEMVYCKFHYKVLSSYVKSEEIILLVLCAREIDRQFNNNYRPIKGSRIFSRKRPPSLAPRILITRSEIFITLSLKNNIRPGRSTFK